MPHAVREEAKRSENEERYAKAQERVELVYGKSRELNALGQLVQLKVSYIWATRNQIFYKLIGVLGAQRHVRCRTRTWASKTQICVVIRV